MVRRVMHEGQLELTTEQVREVVVAAFPDWAGLPVREVPSDGTVNALFRVGPDVVVRFPLQSAPLAETRAELERERDAALRLATMTTIAVPVPIAVVTDREPAWAAYRWLEGTVATAVRPGAALADDVGALLRDLRSVDTGGRRFTGTRRGGRLADHDGYVHESLGRAR
ncbi:phosphotransferase, partial [Desertihabitans aurantiacus]|uniref:phosphotransferase n=1 Tax=Desertihabitans aurantiacus TaxID=2282477 RepID=UPI0013008C7C